MPLVGEHNVRNALAAIAVATDVGIDPARIREGLQSFAGVKRRLEVVGVVAGVTVPVVVRKPPFMAIVLVAASVPELVVEPLFAEDLMLLVHTRHHLSGHDTVPLAELAGEPLMLPPLGTGLRRAIDRTAAGVGVALSPQVEIDGVRLLTSLVFEGYGAAIGPVLKRFFLERGLLLRPLGSVIYLLPPFCLSEEQLDRAYDAIEEAATTLPALT